MPQSPQHNNLVQSISLEHLQNTFTNYLTINIIIIIIIINNSIVIIAIVVVCQYIGPVN
jgi:hypothetical protein